MEALIGLRGAAGNDLGFALRRRMLDPYIEAASPYGVSQSAFLIAGEHDKGDALRRDSAELRNRQLPSGKYFQEHRLESVVYLVQLVNQQHAGPVAFERTHQRTGA